MLQSLEYSIRADFGFGGASKIQKRGTSLKYCREYEIFAINTPGAIDFVIRIFRSSLRIRKIEILNEELTIRFSGSRVGSAFPATERAERAETINLHTLPLSSISYQKLL